MPILLEDLDRRVRELTSQLAPIIITNNGGEGGGGDGGGVTPPPPPTSVVGSWRDQRLLTVRAALGNHQNAPCKIAIICDSEQEVSRSFNQFTADLQGRYPCNAPGPLHINGGLNADAPTYPWVGTGFAASTQGIGSTGRYFRFAPGATLSTNPVLAGDGEFGDRVRIHWISNTGVGNAGTFDVAIDGVTVATGIDTAAGARDASGFGIGTTNNSTYITSFADFTDDMVDALIDLPGLLPPGTRIVRVDNNSEAYVDTTAIATGVANVVNIAIPWWTSDALPKGPHEVVLTGNGADFANVDTIYYYNGNFNSGVQVHVISHSGYTTADFLALSGTGTTTHVPATRNDLQQYLIDTGFHAVIFETAINDGGLSAWQTNMPLLIAATSGSLPKASLIMFLPEPVAARAWMQSLSSVGATIASDHSAVIADMSTIAYDHSGQTGGPDEPHQLTIDGVHYSAKGARLASSVLLDSIDGPPRQDTTWSWYKSPADQGYIMPMCAPEVSALGLAIFADSPNTNPDLFLGYVRSMFTGVGLMAGDPAATSFLPDTFLTRSSPGLWNTLSSGVTIGGVLTCSNAPTFFQAGCTAAGAFGGLTYVGSEYGTATTSVPCTVDLRGGRGGINTMVPHHLDDAVAKILFAGSYISTGYTGSARIEVLAAENWSNTSGGATGSKMRFWVNPLGQDSNTHGVGGMLLDASYRLTIDGGLTVLGGGSAATTIVGNPISLFGSSISCAGSISLVGDFTTNGVLTCSNAPTFFQAGCTAAGGFAGLTYTGSEYGTAGRTVTDGVTNGTTTVTSATAAFVSGDVSKHIYGTDIPIGTTIVSRTNATTVVLSRAATGTHSGATFTIGDTAVGSTVDLRGGRGGDGTLIGAVSGDTLARYLFAGSLIGNYSGAARVEAIATENWATTRAVTDMVTNGTTTITSATAAFTAADVAKSVTGTNITSGTVINSVTNSTTAVLSAAATGSGTGGSLTIGGTGSKLVFWVNPIGTPSNAHGVGGMVLDQNYRLTVDGSIVSGGQITANQYAVTGTFFGIGSTGDALVNALVVSGATSLVGNVGFYNTTPVARPTATGATGTFTAGAGQAWNTQSKITGGVGSTQYTIGDIIRALKLLGLIVS